MVHTWASWLLATGRVRGSRYLGCNDSDFVAVVDFDASSSISGAESQKLGFVSAEAGRGIPSQRGGEWKLNAVEGSVTIDDCVGRNFIVRASTRP